jgi:hypothetical protein
MGNITATMNAQLGNILDAIEKRDAGARALMSFACRLDEECVPLMDTSEA